MWVCTCRGLLKHGVRSQGAIFLAADVARLGRAFTSPARGAVWHRSSVATRTCQQSARRSSSLGRSKREFKSRRREEMTCTPCQRLFRAQFVGQSRPASLASAAHPTLCDQDG
eukprot:3579742-Pleurochrysis_carterae.AAC.9